MKAESRIGLLSRDRRREKVGDGKPAGLPDSAVVEVDRAPDGWGPLRNAREWAEGRLGGRTTAVGWSRSAEEGP